MKGIICDVQKQTIKQVEDTKPLPKLPEVLDLPSIDLRKVNELINYAISKGWMSK